MKRLIPLLLGFSLFFGRAVLAMEQERPQAQKAPVQQGFETEPQELPSVDPIGDEEFLTGEEEYIDDPLLRRPFPRRFWQCTARDRGWEEHWRGHSATGYNYNNVYYRALHECRRFHARCYVNCRMIH